MNIKDRQVSDEIVQTIFDKKFEHANLQFGYVTIPVGERLPAEGTTSHLEHEYSYIIKGQLSGESNGEPFDIKGGQASYIPANEPHWCINTGDSPCELIFAMIEVEK